MPIFNPFITKKVCSPCFKDSRSTSRHQQKAIKIVNNRPKNIGALVTLLNHKIIVVVINKADKEATTGHGLFSTK